MTKSINAAISVLIFMPFIDWHVGFYLFIFFFDEM